MIFPSLPDAWEPTRATLHAHVAIAGVVARSHAPPRANWWHVSLGITERGLATDTIPLPDGRRGAVVVDPTSHVLRLEVEGTTVAAFPLDDPPSTVATRLFADLAGLGLADGYDRTRLHGDPGGTYDPAHAGAFWDALGTVAGALEEQRAVRPGETGPIQLWPHGFDVAFEWFGSRWVASEEEGTTTTASAQLNLGWYPAGDAYFYSNPWPFDPALTATPLPDPARWHMEGWSGTILPYAAVVDDPDGPAIVTAYADAVFEIVRPTLEA